MDKEQKLMKSAKLENWELLSAAIQRKETFFFFIGYAKRDLKVICTAVAWKSNSQVLKPQWHVLILLIWSIKISFSIYPRCLCKYLGITRIFVIDWEITRLLNNFHSKYRNFSLKDPLSILKQNRNEFLFWYLKQTRK